MLAAAPPDPSPFHVLLHLALPSRMKPRRLKGCRSGKLFWRGGFEALTGQWLHCLTSCRGSRPWCVSGQPPTLSPLHSLPAPHSCQGTGTRPDALILMKTARMAWHQTMSQTPMLTKNAAR